jgi:hypothetical protein
MSLLLALHKIAAERGDGLRPELLHLLEKAGAEAVKRAPASTASQAGKSQPKPRLALVRTRPPAPPREPSDEVLRQRGAGGRVHGR